MRTVRLVVAALLVVAAVAAGVWLARDVGEGTVDGSTAVTAEESASIPSTTSPSARSSPSSEDAPGAGSRCDAGTGSVEPGRITVPGVTGRVEVVTPPRDANGIPGVPPLTESGKNVFAWDREQGIAPGDPAGNVLLNAHTWPDGSALGNTLLEGLQRGDQVVVLGEGKRLCYRVTERVEVLAEDGLPRYYAIDGPPQLAIVVCSGRRLAPGVWEKRTVWFASPVSHG